MRTDYARYVNPERGQDEQYYFFRDYQRADVASDDFVRIADGQLSKFGNLRNQNLRCVYGNIGDYVGRFLMFGERINEPVLVPNVRLIGRDHEEPVPTLKLAIASNTNVYFYPEDRRFMGFFITMQPEILHLATPGVSMRLWEKTGYQHSDSGMSYLSTEIQMNFDEKLCTNPQFASVMPELSRSGMLEDLEFLLGFIPRTTPQTIESRAKTSQLKP